MQKNDVNWQVTGLLEGFKGGRLIVLMRLLYEIDYSLFKQKQSYAIAPTITAIFKQLTDRYSNDDFVQLRKCIDVEEIVVKLNDVYKSDVITTFSELLDDSIFAEKHVIDAVISFFVGKAISKYDNLSARIM